MKKERQYVFRSLEFGYHHIMICVIMEKDIILLYYYTIPRESFPKTVYTNHFQNTKFKYFELNKRKLISIDILAFRKRRTSYNILVKKQNICMIHNRRSTSILYTVPTLDQRSRFYVYINIDILYSILYKKDINRNLTVVACII